MNVTVSRPEELRVNFAHVTSDGRVMVLLGEGGDPNSVLLWVKPEQAAQWIEALTPLAAEAEQ